MKALKLAALAAASLFFLASPASAIQDEIGPGPTPGGGSGLFGGGAGGGNKPMRTETNLQAVQKAFDQSNPRANTKRFTYSPDTTYKIQLREFMHTAIILPPGERIAAFSLGDSVNFHFMALKNKDEAVLQHIFEVWADYSGADTNLIIYGGSNNIYSFYLRSDAVVSSIMPDLTVYIEDKEIGDKTRLAVKDVSPAPKPGKQEVVDPEYLRTLPLVDPSKISYAYKIKSGDKGLAPIRIFDDGYFTYFQFSEETNLDKVQRLPVPYRVADGFDVPVNTRAVGGTVIAEVLSDKWTLRNGDAHLCIRSAK